MNSIRHIDELFLEAHSYLERRYESLLVENSSFINWELKWEHGYSWHAELSMYYKELITGVYTF